MLILISAKSVFSSCADYLRCEFALIHQCDIDLIRMPDDMVIGKYVTVRRNYYPRTNPVSLKLTWLMRSEEILKALKGTVIAEWIAKPKWIAWTVLPLSLPGPCSSSP